MRPLVLRPPSGITVTVVIWIIAAVILISLVVVGDGPGSELWFMAPVVAVRADRGRRHRGAQSAANREGAMGRDRGCRLSRNARDHDSQRPCRGMGGAPEHPPRGAACRVRRPRTPVAQRRICGAERGAAA